MIDFVYIAMLFIGLFFVVTASLGVWRFPDIYTRVHAISKGSTFGFSFIILGTAFMLGSSTDIMKALLAVVFLFLTTPVSGHMIARVALKRGYHPVINPQGDVEQRLPLDDGTLRETPINEA